MNAAETLWALDQYAFVILPALLVAEQFGIPLPAVPALLFSRPLWTKPRQIALIVVVVSLVLASTLAPAVAQERLVLFEGRVQWIAAQLMAVQPDGGSSVSIDLMRVRQDEYAGLKVGDWVAVSGLIRNGNRRVIGTSIRRTETEAP